MATMTATANVHERKVASDGVVGIIFLLTSETMFFAGLISAYVVAKASAMVWPPYGQPRLPIGVTAVNTVILLMSGMFMVMFKRKNKNVGKEKIQSLSFLLLSLALGVVFLLVQGSEWAQMLKFGLTSHSSTYGAFFYTIIGAHGLHAVAGLITLLWAYFNLKKPDVANAKSKIDSINLYWCFVVLVWPVLYYLVYF